MSPAGENLFAALSASLADFRVQVEGEPGKKLGAVGTSTGTIPDLVRKVLQALADALGWLADALRDAVDVLRVADALRALVEVARDVAGALAGGLEWGDLPERFGLDPRPFQAVADAVRVGQGALETGLHLAELVPSPDDLNGARQELEKLLGRRANPALKDGGALGRLLDLTSPRPN